MLRFISDNLTTIEGIEIFPIISLVIFFSFFVGLGIYMVKVDKNKIKELKNLPLDEDEQ